MVRRFLGMMRSPQGRDGVLTYLTEALALLGMVLTFRLAALQSKEDLDLYVIVRRTVAFLFPMVLLGAMVGLTRYTAMSASDPVARRYLRGALAWVLPLGLGLWGLCVLFSRPLAWTLFGYDHQATLVPPLGLMTLGIALHGVAYGYLRGRGVTVIANALQITVLALAPCAAFVIFDDMALVLWTTGAAWALSALLSVLPGIFGQTAGGFRREGAELLRYGLPRVPGDVALGALLTVPGYVALRTHGLGVSGEVGFGATLLNIAAAVFSPVALLLLPAASAQLAAGDHAGLAQRIRGMSRVILLASVALMLGFELLAELALDIYLGPTGEQYVPMARLVFLGALPFAYFNGMRSVLDAYFRTPRNGVNLTAAFLLLLIGSALHLIVPTPWYTMGVVLVVALLYLGWATWRDVRFVVSELDRLSVQAGDILQVLVVIPDKEDGQVYADAKREAAELTALGARVTLFHLEDRRSPWRLFRARRKLRNVLKKKRPDVVHVHYGSVAGLFTVLSSAVPVVVTFVGDDLDRSTVPGVARPWLGKFFSQLAAFFAAGLICRDADVRDRLWWRSSEAVVLNGAGSRREAELTLAHLRTVALHKPASMER
jgi:O-antigen/teichoic acid export membrane protein